MANLALVERNDPHFQRDLRKSRPSVWCVAQWLGNRGYDVLVPAAKERPEIEDMDEYADKGDLFISGLGRENHRVEVKRRVSLSFSGLKDWPYPTMIVDAAHCWDRAAQKPVVYVILNPEMTVSAIVRAESAPRWSQSRRWDRFKGRERDFYECQMSDVEFRTLPRTL